MWTKVVSTPDSYFLSLINAAVDAIIVINGAGKIEVFNHAAEGLFGYSSADVIGQNVSKLMPEPDRSAHDQYIQNYCSSREPKIIGIGREVIARHQDGSEFPVFLSVGEIAGSEDIRFIGILRDMSEFHRLELELKTMQSELMHATRLSELGEMTTAINHEINQPITSIATTADACRRMLKSNVGQDSGELIDALDQIYEQSQRMATVTNRLRGFARKWKEQRQCLDINTVLVHALRLLEPELKSRGFELKTMLTADLPEVMIDAIQIQQVIVNLIRNAMDATDGIETANKLISIATIQHGDKLQVAVIDTGSGVADSDVAQLFEPFFTTKNTGTGIGLSISRTIIEAHTGIIEYIKNSSGGSTFQFRLPIASRQKQ